MTGSYTLVPEQEGIGGVNVCHVRMLKMNEKASAVRSVRESLTRRRPRRRRRRRRTDGTAGQLNGQVALTDNDAPVAAGCCRLSGGAARRSDETRVGEAEQSQVDLLSRLSFDHPRTVLRADARLDRRDARKVTGFR